MRFAVLVKATKESEGGALPSREMFAEMGKFNEQLIKDGVMLAGDGLQPSSKGVRLRFDGGQILEIRQIYELEDFGDNYPPEMREREDRVSKRVQ